MNMSEEKPVVKKPGCRNIGCTTLTVLAVLGFLYFALCLLYPAAVGSKRSRLESQACTVLRFLADIEDKYHRNDRISNMRFGSIEELIDKGYIEEAWLHSDYLKYYSYSIYVYNPEWSSYLPAPNAAFTIVAFPRTTRPPGYFAIFAIREDQVLRVYRPDIPGVKAWGEDGDYGCRTWEPIR